MVKQINEELEENKFDEFDLEQAEKLLENIQYMSNLTKFPVRKPNSLTMELTTVDEWVRWYVRITEWNGSSGTENEVMEFIKSIDSDLTIMVKRIEEAFRVLIRVLERRELRLELQQNEIENLKSEILLIKNKNSNEEIDEKENNDEEVVIEKKSETIIKEEVKKDVKIPPRTSLFPQKIQKSSAPIKKE